MVDPVTAAATVGNANDDWEVPGELDKRLAQQDIARASNPEAAAAAAPSVADDDAPNTATFNIMNSNKPIRILKRPTSQSQISTGNDAANSAAAPTATPSSTANTHANNSSTPSSATVPVVSIIPRNSGRDASAASETIATPVFSSTPSSSSQPTKPAIKTYEQRELEYRLARLRIMGEEESSAKDDDETPAVDVTPVPTDENVRATTASATTRAPNKMSAFAQPPFQSHSTPGSYASELYALNNVSSNTGTIHFTPNHNNNNSSTPNLGTGPFSSPNFPQHYRNTYTGPYSHMLPTTGGMPPRYPLPATTTTTLYMTSTAPFTSASSSTASPTYHYPPPQHAHMSTNNWYPHYQHPPTPYGAPQYGHPQ